MQKNKNDVENFFYDLRYIDFVNWAKKDTVRVSVSDAWKIFTPINSKPKTRIKKNSNPGSLDSWLEKCFLA